MIMDKIALTLLIIGGLNWGSVGLFRFDLVAFGLRRFRQYDQPRDLYPGGSFRRVVHLSALPGQGPRGGAELRPVHRSIQNM